MQNVTITSHLVKLFVTKDKSSATKSNLHQLIAPKRKKIASSSNQLVVPS